MKNVYNYKVIELLSILLDRELLYQNKSITIQLVLFNSEFILLFLEDDSEIEFESLQALHSFLCSCLATTPLKENRNSAELFRAYKESCNLVIEDNQVDSLQNIIKLSTKELENKMKIKNKIKTVGFNEKHIYLYISEIERLYDTNRYKLLQLAKSNTDPTLCYQDGKGITYFAVELLDATYTKRVESKTTTISSITINNKELKEVVGVEATKVEQTKVEKINQKLGIEVDGKQVAKAIEMVGFDVKELQDDTDRVINKKVSKKGEVKDFTPNDDDTGEYCNIESNDLELVKEFDLGDLPPIKAKETIKGILITELNPIFKELEAFSETLKTSEPLSENNTENNQDSKDSLLFYKTIFSNFEDLKFTQEQLVFWQKRSSQTEPLTSEEKEKFNLFMQSSRMYAQFLKIEQNYESKNNNHLFSRTQTRINQ